MDVGNSVRVGGSRGRVRAHWVAHVSAQGLSGLSAADYCREHGLRAKSFYRWRRVLRESGELGELLGAGGPRPVDSVGIGSNALFAEVVLPVGVTAPAASGVEVALRSGAVVRVSRCFDAETLRRVVSALEGGAC
jgi:hypothetical protein